MNNFVSLYTGMCNGMHQCRVNVAIATFHKHNFMSDSCRTGGLQYVKKGVHVFCNTSVITVQRKLEIFMNIIFHCLIDCAHKHSNYEKSH
jgi:hypothetical protein